MNIESIIFFDMLVAIFILSIALVAVVLRSKNDIGNLSDTRQKAGRMIDEANNRAMDIINKANLSTDITSENFNQELKRIASLQIKEFEKATSDFMKLYSLVLQDLKSKNIEVFQNISKDIEVNTMEEIKNFKESMESLTVSSQNLVQKKIDNDYLTAKKEIQNYKEIELKKIDQGIYAILERISKLVLGKALNLSEHEDLIQKSLEKAKKEGAFGK